MNLGQAVAICMYELARARPIAESKEKKTQASAGEVERITTLLFKALRTSGYVQPRTAAATEEKVRRLIRRLQVEKRDAELLQGMLRQISWKLGTDDQR